MGRLALWLAAALIWAGAAQAQVATLVADRVDLDGGAIRATGNVEIALGSARLTAAAIVYDGDTQKLTIEGPIVLTEGDGQSVLMADAAELDADLRNGVLVSARLVLARELQLAASRISRIDGRLTRLSRTVASTCRIDAAGNVPLWQIRAAEVTHDQDLRRLYFENAVLEVAGLPVFYIPRLSLPDPTQTRASGFLAPRQRSSTLLGTAVEIPYFLTFGQSRDLTVTPLLSARTRTLNLRYRQAFRAGRVEANAALTSDELLPGATRGYLFAEGRFTLADDLRLSFDLKYASDPTYLATYAITQDKLLESVARLERTDARSDMITEINAIRILSGPELAYGDTVPKITARFDRRRILDIPGLGGTTTWRLSADAALRESAADQAGRDRARFGTELRWNAARIFGPGFVAATGVQAGLDAHVIAQDSRFPAVAVRGDIGAELELRWPQVRAEPGGAVQTLEPVIQLAYSRSFGDPVPNEDSRTAVLDEGNLFDITRFAGDDATEAGARAAVGLIWTRSDAGGRGARLAAGAVVSDRAEPDHPSSSGLSGIRSDLLVAGQFDLGRRLSLDGQTLIGWDGSLTLADLRVDWDNGRTSLSARHSWAAADAGLNRPEPVAEIALDGAYAINSNWSLTGSWQYDYNQDQTVQNRLGLTYRNECVSVDLSASRRFQSSANIVADTDFGLQIELLGFGSGGGGAGESCAKGG